MGWEWKLSDSNASSRATSTREESSSIPPESKPSKSAMIVTTPVAEPHSRNRRPGSRSDTSAPRTES